MLFRVLRDASVCLMLSIHEGFGLTGWEAVAAEVPLIVSENTGLYALLERSGGQALGCVHSIDIRGRVDPPFYSDKDVGEVTRALRAIANNQDTAKSNAQALRGLLSEYTWEATARRLLNGLGLGARPQEIRTTDRSPTPAPAPAPAPAPPSPPPVGTQGAPSNRDSPSPTSDHAERFGWGHLFDSVVDAAIYLDDFKLARDDIVEAIRLGTLIPSRYHYSSDTGADRWLRMCEDSGYQHHQRTLKYWMGEDGGRMADLVRGEIDSLAFDYVSLGPGDGRKDASLVVEWMSAGIDLFYFPYDVSVRITAHAVHQVREAARRCQSGSLRVKAVLADFLHFTRIADVFGHRDKPNVVALLGTLGNLNNEHDVLRNIRITMGRDDLLLLEVRLNSESALAGLKSDTSVQHDFGPLEYYLGSRCNPADMDMLPVDEARSTVPKTVTYAVTYSGDTGLEFKHDKVLLQYMHLYDRDAFVAAARESGFHVLEQYVDPDSTFLECLLRRRR